MIKKLKILLMVCIVFLLSCRKDEIIFKAEEETVSTTEYTSIDGFYLLNEGNMGSNKATLDYYNYQTATYSRNIYAERNPQVVKELGDVGNDIKIYGSKLYVVINCSNKVEVLDAKTAKRIGQINIPNARYIQFYGGYAYISSYAGPVELNPNYEQKGYVAKIDTTTFQELARCIVGFQPEEIEIANGKLYVANSGGYMFPNYENTISVIDLHRFTEIKKIKVAINLHRLRVDRQGNLWASSRGNYYSIPSRLYCIDTKKDKLSDSLNISVSNFHLDGDSLYIYGVEWNYISNTNKTNYGIVDVVKKVIVSSNFISDGSEANIKIPYGITVNPISKDIYITDAKNYVSPGTLYCFDKNGKQKWKVRTGDIPAHFVFVGNSKKKSL